MITLRDWFPGNFVEGKTWTGKKKMVSTKGRSCDGKWMVSDLVGHKYIIRQCNWAQTEQICDYGYSFRYYANFVRTLLKAKRKRCCMWYDRVFIYLMADVTLSDVHKLLENFAFGDFYSRKMFPLFNDHIIYLYLLI